MTSLPPVTTIADMEVEGLRSDRMLEIASPGGIRYGRSIECCSRSSIGTIFRDMTFIVKDQRQILREATLTGFELVLVNVRVSDFVIEGRCRHI